MQIVPLLLKTFLKTELLEPKVSIMMISYNNVNFLQEAISTVQHQTYSNWELIIQDDCSTDGSFELALSLAKDDERIKVFQNEQNCWTPWNRKKAIQHATGQLVCHLDSDDVLYPEAVTTMVRFFTDHPDIALAYSDTAFIDESGNVYSYSASRDPDSNLAWFGWRHFGMYRMSVYMTIAGYNDKLPSCEDGDLFMQIAEKYKFARVPVVLYAQRYHANNTSRTNKECGQCPSRGICNYARVWAQHAGYDLETWTPKESSESSVAQNS